MKELVDRYKSVILYLFFGGCTTLVNIAIYYACAHIVNLGTMQSTIIAWVIAVLFAYMSNRKWVFASREVTVKGVLGEMARFFGCRLATGAVDWICMLVCVEFLLWNDIIVKTGANILVIILNYIASKVIIFRKRDTHI